RFLALGRGGVNEGVVVASGVVGEPGGRVDQGLFDGVVGGAARHVEQGGDVLVRQDEGRVSTRGRSLEDRVQLLRIVSRRPRLLVVLPVALGERAAVAVAVVHVVLVVAIV